MKNSYDKIQEYEFDSQKIKQAAVKALGYFEDRDIRQWLVEIESLK